MAAMPPDCIPLSAGRDGVVYAQKITCIKRGALLKNSGLHFKEDDHGKHF